MSRRRSAPAKRPGGVKVLGGCWRGRRLAAPEGARPTQARLREALFSHWGDRVNGSRVLELYAGSGAVSFEALSRGAGFALAVDRSSRAQACMRESREALGADDLRLAAAVLPGDLGERGERGSRVRPRVHRSALRCRRNRRGCLPPSQRSSWTEARSSWNTPAGTRRRRQPGGSGCSGTSATGTARWRSTSERAVVRKGGLEPPRYCYHKILNLARLPIPPLSQAAA